MEPRRPRRARMHFGTHLAGRGRPGSNSYAGFAAHAVTARLQRCPETALGFFQPGLLPLMKPSSIDGAPTPSSGTNAFRNTLGGARAPRLQLLRGVCGARSYGAFATVPRDCSGIFSARPTSPDETFL